MVILNSAVVGFTSLAFLGFVGLGFNVFGGIGGGAAGIFLGRYAGAKISKKMSKTKGVLEEFHVFMIRMRCVLKWVLFSYME